MILYVRNEKHEGNWKITQIQKILKIDHQLFYFQDVTPYVQGL